MSLASLVIRVLLSGLMGGLIGLEREIHGCAAGLRTHILVSIGSALFMVSSIYMSIGYGHLGTVDPSRIAAGIVTGIGFLGAGAIIRYGWSIRGLTTAASIWTVAAIGMSVGAGLYMPAAVTTIVVVAVLFLSRIEDFMESRMQSSTLAVAVSMDRKTGLEEVKSIIEVYGGRIKRISSEDIAGGKSRRFLFDVLVYYSAHRRDIISDIASLPGIEEVEFK